MTERPLGKWLNLRMGRDPDIQPVSVRELQEWQFASLRQTLFQAVKNCPFYHERLAGIQTGAVHSPADLEKLPFTTADDLRNGPENFLCVSQDEVARAVTLASSGSSGPPKRLFSLLGTLKGPLNFSSTECPPCLRKGKPFWRYCPTHAPEE